MGKTMKKHRMGMRRTRGDTEECMKRRKDTPFWNERIAVQRRRCIHIIKKIEEGQKAIVKKCHNKIRNTANEKRDM